MPSQQEYKQKQANLYDSPEEEAANQDALQKLNEAQRDRYEALNPSVKVEETKNPKEKVTVELQGFARSLYQVTLWLATAFLVLCCFAFESLFSAVLLLIAAGLILPMDSWQNRLDPYLSETARIVIAITLFVITCMLL